MNPVDEILREAVVMLDKIATQSMRCISQETCFTFSPTGQTINRQCAPVRTEPEMPSILSWGAVYLSVDQIAHYVIKVEI